MSLIGNIRNIKNSAFGDAIFVEPTPILQYAFEYDMVNNTKVWNKFQSGSGAVSTVDAKARATTGTTAGSVAYISSVRPARYRSGFGGRFRFTTTFSAPVSDGKQVAVIGDELGSAALFKNGYGVGYIGTTLKLLHFMNDMDVSINYSNPDGFTLDPTKLNIWQIDYAYLGTGDIVYSVYVDSKKDFVEVGRIQRSNSFSVPHSYNPNYKLGIYATNGTQTTDVRVETASMGYFIMGRTKYSENQVYSNSYEATASGITTQTQLFSIRNKTSYTSVTNFIDVMLENVSGQLEAAANARAKIKLCLNPTLGGTASWTDISTTDSIVEVDTAQTTVTSQGQVLAVIYLAGSFDKANLVDLIGENLLISPGDEVAVLVESTGNATITAFLSWKEIF